MSMFWIIYFIGVLLFLAICISTFKYVDDLTVKNLICIMFMSLFSFLALIAVICINIKMYIVDTDVVQKFLDKKL